MDNKTQVINRINDYLLQLNMSYEVVGEGMWVVSDEYDNVENLVISYENPLVIFRVKLMDVPTSNKEEFFEKLLRLNASSLTHGAYALENNHVVIVETLEAENLDLNELIASVDAIIMAISQDYKELSQYLN